MNKLMTGILSIATTSIIIAALVYPNPQVFVGILGGLVCGFAIGCYVCYNFIHNSMLKGADMAHAINMKSTGNPNALASTVIREQGKLLKAKDTVKQPATDSRTQQIPTINFDNLQ